EQFTHDPQRLARFEREAKLLASLNHPNSAAIYGLEEADGVRFLALELVPGDTLAERVARGPLPVEEALEICRQIAQGVEAAHEKGVIHRDLKPANVKITPEGKVKILDFGLAKAFEAEPPVTDISQSPTLTEEMTRAGVILGTAAYMSPEQAKGKPVDNRADIFAFGAVLYELLTGKRAFEGETITETIAAVLKSEPDWELLPDTAPHILRALLRRSLEKEPPSRLQHMTDVRIFIEEARTEASTLSPLGLSSAPQPAGWKIVLPWSIAVVTALIAIITVWTLTGPATRPPTKFLITPPADASLTELGNHLAISPDGRRIVYRVGEVNSEQLYLRSLDDVVARAIPGTEGATYHAFFSPDGEWIAFFTNDGKLKKVSLSGGAPITLGDASGWVSGSWGSEGTIVFTGSLETGQTHTLNRIAAGGGEPEILATPNQGEGQYQHPESLPGGKAVLFTASTPVSSEIRILLVETGEQKLVLAAGRQARYVETGHVVYAQAASGGLTTGTLMAVPFDLARLEATGDPVPVLQGVRLTVPGFVDYAVSEAGTLVYVPGRVEGVQHKLVWVDRNGGTQPLTDIQREFHEPRFSPDGGRLTVTIRDRGVRNIWIYEIDRGILTPFTLEGENTRAIWSPDGKRLLFSSNRAGVANLFWMPTDRSAEAEQLTTSSTSLYPTSWSPHGLVAYVELSGTQPRSIGVVPLEGEREPETVATEYMERNAIFSPNGRWIAFTSDRSGQTEVYVKPYPGQGGLVQISTDGGLEPVWAQTGKELFYRNGDQMMVVAVETEATFQAERPSLLFEGSYAYNYTGMTSNYDITPDGQRFVMVQATQESAPAQIQVVLNWFEELKRLAPAN
ncbi:MAG: protein kinase, partial [Acidobacteria bacterium]|nr:protein kinase [Acidobacteriota bacterium]